MKIFKYLLIFNCFLFVFLMSCPGRSDAIKDAIIAVVNDELITLKDLKDYAKSTYISLIAEGMSDDQIQGILKEMEVNGTNKLIEDKLILSKANTVGILVKEGLIDKRVDEVTAKYGSEQGLVNALIKNGATMTDLRDKIRDQLKIKFIVDHEVKSKIYVNPQEVTNFYEGNREQFSQEDRIDLKSIYIAFGEDKYSALKKAVEAFKYAAAENDFDEIVDQYSEAPSIGTVKRGELMPVIEDTVFDLSLNELSPMVEVENGIYIFKLIGETPSQISGLDDVKDSIYDHLFMEKFKGEFVKWVEDLKENAYIEIKQ